MCSHIRSAYLTYRFRCHKWRVATPVKNERRHTVPWTVAPIVESASTAAVFQTAPRSRSPVIWGDLRCYEVLSGHLICVGLLNRFRGEIQVRISNFLSGPTFSRKRVNPTSPNASLRTNASSFWAKPQNTTSCQPRSRPRSLDRESHSRFWRTKCPSCWSKSCGATLGRPALRIEESPLRVSGVESFQAPANGPF